MKEISIIYYPCLCHMPGCGVYIIRYNENILALEETYNPEICSNDDYIVQYPVYLTVKELEWITKYKNRTSLLNSKYYRACIWMQEYDGAHGIAVPEDIRSVVEEMRQKKGFHKLNVALRNIFIYILEIPSFVNRLYGVVTGVSCICYEVALTHEAFDSLKAKYDPTIEESREYEGCIDSCMSLKECHYKLCISDILNILFHKYASGILEKECYDGKWNIRLKTFTR